MPPLDLSLLAILLPQQHDTISLISRQRSNLRIRQAQHLHQQLPLRILEVSTSSTSGSCCKSTDGRLWLLMLEVGLLRVKLRRLLLLLLSRRRGHVLLLRSILVATVGVLALPLVRRARSSRRRGVGEPSPLLLLLLLLVWHSLRRSGRRGSGLTVPSRSSAVLSGRRSRGRSWRLGRCARVAALLLL